MSIVYVLSNLAMPGMVKIGRTTADHPKVRMDQLYTVGVPLPFECEKAVDVGDEETAINLEKALHTAFGPNRVNPRREFFEIEVDQVDALLSVWPQATDVTPQVESDGDGVDEADIAAAERFKKNRRPNLNFREMGVREGSVLKSVQTGGEVTVVGDKEVEYKGEVMSLSAATKTVLETGYSIAPTPHWNFDDQSLKEIYEETYGPRAI